MIRQPGFYWIKLKDDIGTQWERATIGEFLPEGWWEVVRSDEIFLESEILVVSDRLEKPDE